MNIIYVAAILYAILAAVEIFLMRRWIKKHEAYVKNLAIQTGNMANTQYKQTLLLGNLAERVTALEPKEESEG